MKIVIPDIDRKTWGEILKPVDAAVAALPSKTPEQQVYSEAAIHLRNVKNAWRDGTMHNRLRYDKDEAETIFQSVKKFVNDLLTLPAIP